jgi:hypothetical protein
MISGVRLASAHAGRRARIASRSYVSAQRLLRFWQVRQKVA